MGFNDPEKVRIYGYGGYLLSNRFANHPCDDLPEVPIHRTANGLLFYARGTVSWNWSSNTYQRVQNCYSNDAYYFVTENDDDALEFPVEIGRAHV